jgi:hypothetical protein
LNQQAKSKSPGTEGWWNTFSEADWLSLAEFEAILNATKITSSQAQFEGFAGAFGPAIKLMTMNLLRADSLEVIDMPLVTKGKVITVTLLVLNEFG